MSVAPRPSVDDSTRGERPSETEFTVHRPPLETFGSSETFRVVVIGFVLVTRMSCRLIGHMLTTVVSRGRRKQRSMREVLAEGVVDAFERLGPMFVKLGQLIASSSGAFPRELSDACLRCLDDMPPFPAAQARRIIEQDLGRSIADLFRSFEDTPLSAASVAQVHACVLADGREAVVKVQRPGIARRMIVDLRAALVLARLLERRSQTARVANAVGVVRDLYEVTVTELNFLIEADNQSRIRDNIGAFGDNDAVTVPEVYWELCSRRVVCMERMHGVPLDRFDAITAAHPDPEMLIRRLVKVWLEGVVVHGLFHGDVHAGNMWLLDDGRLAMLDFGIVGTMTPPWRELVRALFHASAFGGDFTPVVTALRELDLFAEQSADDMAIGRQLAMVLGPILKGELARLDLKTVTTMLVEFGARRGVAGPQQLILMGKQLGYFERYAITLAPGWQLGTDLFLLRNLFPDEVAAAARREGIELPEF
ncbi:ABC1 kinase family protein [Nocardia paucivorans]|uniref:ABC1 kinase family protein n=1 Tax=Nocardia paucivorans TaxID=114259 RepID=UPI00031779CA|nr:AarF/ABC1/UbiB kinase family protein [Nocardia paucivorans]